MAETTEPLDIVEITDFPGQPLAQIEQREIRKLQREDPLLRFWIEAVRQKKLPPKNKVPKSKDHSIMVCRGGFKYCQEAVDNVESVTSCPTSEKEWESAANRKNCQLTAAQQTCSEPETFLYHCVLNGYGNETLEVCAPRRLVIGFCTEFNVAGGVIQSHISAPCNKLTELICNDVYYSTHAYRYPGCYDIVYKKQTKSSTTIAMPNETTISDESKNRNTQITVAIVVAVVIVTCIVITVIGVILLKGRKTRTPELTDVNEMDTLITGIDGNVKGFQKLKSREKMMIEEEIEDSCTPGQPIANASGLHSYSVDLQWAKSAKRVDYYQIRYKTKDDDDEWKFAKTDNDQSKITITGLLANTKYVFQVRSVYQDQEGQYGPESNDVLTAESASTSLLNSSKQVSNGIPPKYQLFVEELENSRNINAKTKQIVVGDFKQTEYEKTIMLVGATGSGKSTLIDGIVNYVMGVNFDDPFRFTLIQLEKEENMEYNQVLF
uniref:Fibronectin type-III domain-containing protein n=1 Tax=Magallana gigas TaxID=29159 RepID=A0A8W8JGK9_MAGGI